jgi:hypothetical protein
MLKHALKLKMQYAIVTSWIWEYLLFDDSISCVLKYSQFNTNFPFHNLILEMVQNLLFHGFVVFAHRCYAFKTRMMHV